MGSLRVAPILVALISSLYACMRVTPGEPGIPAVPCKSCAEGLLATDPITMGKGAKTFDGDMTDPTGSCSVRTLTCKGHMASIELSNAGGTLGAVDGMGTDTATFKVTCNAAGTAWFATANNMDIEITRAECSVPYCYRCDETMLTVNEAGPGVKMMDDDQITFPPGNGCAQRTFTCKGNGATIGISTAAGAIPPVTDMGTGTATYVVTCNADGTGWEAGGQKITQVECRNAGAAGTCTGCTNAQIITMPMPPGANPLMFSPDNTVVGADGCYERTLTCTAPPKDPANPTTTWTAYIEIWSDPTMKSDGQLDGNPSVSFTVNCKADGSGWEERAFGLDIKQLECTFGAP